MFKFNLFTWVHDLVGYFTFNLGGDPPAPAPTTSTSYSTNVPEYAQPYVENMLNAAQAQIYNPSMTGFNTYTPYSNNPTDYVAGVSPMQQQAYSAAANMQVPGQYGAATNATIDTMNQLGNMQYNPLASNYMSTQAPTLQNFGMTGPADVSGAQGTSAQLNAVPNAQAAQLSTAPQAQSAQFQGPGSVGYQNVGAQNVNAQALQNFLMGPASQVNTQDFTQPGTAQQYMNPYLQSALDPQMKEMQRQYAITGQQEQAKATQAGAFGGTREALMAAENQRNKNTAMNQVLGQGYNNAFQQAQQQFNTQQAANLQAQQANQQAGLTVGSQNLASLLGVQQLGAGQNLQAQQLNQAAGLQSGLANQSAGIQTGLANQQSAYNTALQNALMQQQTGLSNQQLAGQYGLQQGQFNQAANLANQQMAGQYGMQQGNMNQAMNLANMQNQQQANLANQQMGYNVGNTNLQSLLGVQQLGAGQNLQSQLANQGAYGQAQQLAANQQQFGANLGLQGLQAQMAGANQLAGIGGSQLAAQQGIAGLQNQYGQQQQAQQQNIINQAVQNYATAQQYPFMQLGLLNSMLRGLPMQQSSTQMYQAPPNPLAQAAGLASTAYGLTRKKGGIIKAAGGIPMSHYSDQQLKQVQKSPIASPLEKVVASGELGLQNYIKSNPESKQIFAQPLTPPQQVPPSPQQMAMMPQNRSGLDAIGTDDMTQMAGGGIIAFADTGEVPTAQDPADQYFDINPKTKEKSFSIDKFLFSQLSNKGPSVSDAIMKDVQAQRDAMELAKKGQEANKWLNVGSTLLSSKSPFFTQALGEAGQAYTKSQDESAKDLATRQSEITKSELLAAEKDEAAKARMVGIAITANAAQENAKLRADQLRYNAANLQNDKDNKNAQLAIAQFEKNRDNYIKEQTKIAGANLDTIDPLKLNADAYRHAYNTVSKSPIGKYLTTYAEPDIYDVESGYKAAPNSQVEAPGTPPKPGATAVQPAPTATFKYDPSKGLIPNTALKPPFTF